MQIDSLSNKFQVQQIDVDEGEFRFLKPTQTPGMYVWPDKEDISWEPLAQIARVLKPPCLVPGRGIKLFCLNELSEI